MDPLTLGALGAVALSEGIRFLYGQAGEVLRWRRERKKAAEEGISEAQPEPIQIRRADIVAGELEPAVIDFEAADRLEEDLQFLTQQLGNYASGIQDVDSSDENLLRATDALRLALEAIYQQRITFKGEERPPSGPVVEGRVDVEGVAGYAAAVRAATLNVGHIRGELRAKRVESGGEAIGVDVQQIGGRTVRDGGPSDGADGGG